MLLEEEDEDAEDAVGEGYADCSKGQEFVDVKRDRGEIVMDNVPDRGCGEHEDSGQQAAVNNDRYSEDQMVGDILKHIN